MQKAFHILGALACVAALVLCSVLAILAYRAIHIESEIAEAIRVINDPRRGTLYELNKAITDTGDLIKETHEEVREAKKTEDYEAAQVPIITGQIKGVISEANSLLASLRGTSNAMGDTARSATGVLAATQESVKGIAPILEQTRTTLVGLEPVESAAAKTLNDADSLVKDPDISASLRNVNDGTAQIAATAKDVREEVHAITHPKPAAQIIGWVLKISQVAGSWLGGLL